MDVHIVEQYEGNMVKPAQIIVFGAVLATITTILQSAGAIGGMGFLLSALSTFPILVASILSIRLGFLSYIVTLLMLSFIQPSELFTFPFTTGILGLSMGISIKYLKRGYFIPIFSGFSLALGIMLLLYVIRFPVLGPSVTANMDAKISIIILLFSIVYSWIWLKVFVFLVKKFHKLCGKGIK